MVGGTWSPVISAVGSSELTWLGTATATAATAAAPAVAQACAALLGCAGARRPLQDDVSIQ